MNVLDEKMASEPVHRQGRLIHIETIHYLIVSPICSFKWCLPRTRARTITSSHRGPVIIDHANFYFFTKQNCWLAWHHPIGLAMSLRILNKTGKSAKWPASHIGLMSGPLRTHWVWLTDNGRRWHNGTPSALPTALSGTRLSIGRLRSSGTSSNVRSPWQLDFYFILLHRSFFIWFDLSFCFTEFSTHSRSRLWRRKAIPEISCLPQCSNPSFQWVSYEFDGVKNWSFASRHAFHIPITIIINALIRIWTLVCFRGNVLYRRTFGYFQ